VVAGAAEAVGAATPRRVVEAAAEAVDVATSRQTVDVAVLAVDVAISLQTVDAAVTTAAVAGSHPEAVGQWPFVVDRQEVVVVLAYAEEVPRRSPPEYTCMSPLLSGTHATFNDISRSQYQYTNLDAVQTRSPLIRIPKSPNLKTPGLR
jgi:hypothetical protein